jgi:hypothetical protein
LPLCGRIGAVFCTSGIGEGGAGVKSGFAPEEAGTVDPVGVAVEDGEPIPGVI